MRFEEIDQNIPFIKKENFRLLFPEIKPSSFTQNIKNWIKTGKIAPLKRGFYVFKHYWNNCADKDNYLGYLAGMLYTPSYVSRETILAKYGMLTEAVYGISSVSIKTTRVFKSDLSIFTYSKIKEALFGGFVEGAFMGNKYYIATKAKALFDYLYFYKRRMKNITEKAIDELRINFEVMKNSDWKEFRKYLKLAEDKALDKIYSLIIKGEKLA
ncbi:hypothetical protein A2246_01120 [candidate division WOR-1 bacterium RIFOXYA2_FULL_37_7]|nr:MAG: hypothetical protein A2246_01120 [candidate division WOR-1 bacterium RIFOXYA2_FULL_37_7]